jgi:Icc-related predicted phosphoesterase
VTCIAAVGDIHLGPDDHGRFRPAFEQAAREVDMLLLAGDLTRHGTVPEAEAVAQEVKGLDLPVIAVLGNHDYHSDCAGEVVEILEEAGVQVLEGSGTVIEVGGVRVGIAGTKGFGTGFPGKQASEFGEPEMKSFVRHSRDLADRFGLALRTLDCDLRIALTHYSPSKDTLLGEPPEIHAFLGSYHLAEAIDDARADLAVHGHAHRGTAKGLTPGGVRVRNVAHPVIGCAYAVFDVRQDADRSEVRSAAYAASGGSTS